MRVEGTPATVPDPPDSSPEPGLVLDGIEFSYPGGSPVLRGISTEVPRGTVRALLGPSGCGKTTLLRIIAGLEAPDAGSVSSLDRRVLTDASRGVSVDLADRRVAMVFQNWALFPHMDVAANVSFGMSREARRNGELLAETLAMVGLEGLEARRPAELSGGQQQRVALARALAQRPDVLLLDEPFSNLDPALRSRVREEVRGLLEDLGVTTVLVTHDREEAFLIGDTVSLLRAGDLVAEGEPAELYEHPPDRWSAEFLGPAVLLEGTVADGARVRTPLGLLVPRDGAWAEVGESVIVMVRPEALGIGPAAGDGRVPPDAGAVAVVEDVRYRGPSTTYRVRLSDSVAKTDDPAGGQLLEVERRGGPAFAAGERVVVTGPPSPVVTWRDGSAV